MQRAIKSELIEYGADEIKLRLTRGIPYSGSGHEDLVADIYRWLNSDNTVELTLPRMSMTGVRNERSDLSRGAVDQRGVSDDQIGFIATVSSAEEALIRAYFTGGNLVPGSYLRPSIVLPTIKVSRTLFAAIDDCPGFEYGLSFGRHEMDRNTLVLRDPLPTSVTNYIPEDQAKTFGSGFYDPLVDRFIGGVSHSPVGGHTLGDVETRVRETALAKERLKDLDGLALPQVLAVYDSPILNGEENIYGVAYKRPVILYPWQVYEAATISRDPLFWEFYIEKSYANVADMYRVGRLAHMQLHGTNRGITVESNPRAYVGDWTTTVDLERYDDRKRCYIAHVELFNPEVEVQVIKSNDPADAVHFGPVADRGLLLHLTPRDIVIFQSLISPLEHDISNAFRDREFTLRQWPEYGQDFSIMGRFELVFTHTLAAIDRAFQIGDGENMSYLLRQAMADGTPDTVSQLIDDLDRFVPGFMRAIAYSMHHKQEVDLFIVPLMTRVMAAYLMTRYFSGELLKAANLKNLGKPTEKNELLPLKPVMNMTANAKPDLDPTLQRMLATIPDTRQGRKQKEALIKKFKQSGSKKKKVSKKKRR